MDPINSDAVTTTATTSNTGDVVSRSVTATPAAGETVVAPVSPFPASIAGVTTQDEISAMLPSIKSGLSAMLGDFLGSAREGVAEFIDDLAPEIAKQTILSASDDPVIRQRATDHLRHLKGQSITRAGTRIIGFEQRQETRLWDAVNAVMTLARTWTLGRIGVPATIADGTGEATA